jgi:hypothetical protein
MYENFKLAKDLNNHIGLLELTGVLVDHICPSGAR